MLDLFRYGASLESWTGHLFLCAAIGFYYLKPTKLQGPAFIIASSYWLICSGHPQMMYYGLLGAGLFAFVFPFFVKAVLSNQPLNSFSPGQFWFRIGIFCSIGFLLASAYILPFYFDFVVNNADRAAQGYAWADEFRDTVAGTLNNFFNPLRSDVHGVFGGSSLILMVALLPVLRIFRMKVPPAIWGIWGLLVVAFLHMQGARTPVHFLVWKFLPMASAFRVAGRISLIMPVFFMLVLTWLASSKALKFRFFNRQMQVFPQTLLATAAFLLLCAYFPFNHSNGQVPTIFSASSIRAIPNRVELITLFCGAASLAVVGIYGHLQQYQTTGQIILFFLVLTQMLLLLQYGTWVERKEDTPTLAQMYQTKEKSLNYHHQHTTGYGVTNRVISRHIQSSFLEPYLGKIYHSYRNADNNNHAYAFMEQDQSPDEVVLEQYSPGLRKQEKKSISNGQQDSIKLQYSSFNRLVFEVQCAQAAFFGLAYPYTGHWSAYVNNQKVIVYRANGSYQAVEVPGGSSQVEFRYWSAASFWGMLISCMTVLIIALLAAFIVQKWPQRVVIVVLSFGLGFGGFGFWYHSLYHGSNLQTRYTWKETPVSSSAPPNIAYGKRTYMSSLFNSNYAYYRSSAQAVDGMVAPASGFITGLETQPWWVVDLHQPRSIESFVIYEGITDSKFNVRPLKVAFSNDQKAWHTVKTISAVNHGSPLIIKLEKPQDARYLLVMASGECYLSFDEVEIYTAKNADSK